MFRNSQLLMILAGTARKVKQHMLKQTFQGANPKPRGNTRVRNSIRTRKLQPLIFVRNTSLIWCLSAVPT